jgi:Protein of unknown function (DUF2637)
VHDTVSRPHPTDPSSIRRQAARLRRWARLVLVPVAVIGAVLSFRSLYTAATPVFGRQLALGFPLLVDFLILGASLQYVAGAKVGRGRAGWRWTAHAGVAGTLLLNALAARNLGEVPWHITAPAVWSVLVELTAREVLGEWRATHPALGEQIPVRLWLTAPLESTHTWLRMARRVQGEQAVARLDVGVHAAAVEALKLALPQRRARRVRRILQRQLRAGSLPPAAILGPLGWTDDLDALVDITPESILRAALRGALAPVPAPDTSPRIPAPSDSSAPATGALEVTTRLPQSPSPSPDVAPPQPGGPITRPVEEADATAVAQIMERGVAQIMERGTVIDVTDRGLAAPGVRTPDLSAARAAGSDRAEEVPFTAVASSGDRLADSIDLLRANDELTAQGLAEQLRALGWPISDRTAARVLSEARLRLRDDRVAEVNWL